MTTLKATKDGNFEIDAELPAKISIAKAIKLMEDEDLDEETYSDVMVSLDWLREHGCKHLYPNNNTAPKSLKIVDGYFNVNRTAYYGFSPVT